MGSGARLPKLLFLPTALLAIAESARDFRLLPDRLASHFTMAGSPNNWIEKPEFYALYAGLIMLAAAVSFLSLPLMTITPPWAFNLPNKQYWLSPAHRQDTFLYLDRYFAWTGLLLLIFEVFTMHLVLQANLRPTPELPTGVLLSFLAVFVLFNAGAAILLARHFSSLPAEG